MKRLILLLILCSATGLAQAQTRYVSDQLQITLRTGESSSNKILKSLTSGTPVQVLQTDPAAGYTQVQLADGTQGWVLTRFLMDQPAARDQLAAADKKLQDLQTQLEQAGATQQQVAQLKAQNTQLTEQLAEIRRTASSAIAIDKENKELKTQLMSTTQDLETVRQENEALRDRTRMDWFMVGGGVLVAGILLGLILPRLRVRRRSSWDSL